MRDLIRLGSLEAFMETDGLKEYLLESFRAQVAGKEDQQLLPWSGLVSF